MAPDHYVSQVHLRNFSSLVLGNKMHAIRKRGLLKFPCGVRINSNLDSRTKCNAGKRLVEDFERRLVAQPFARSIIQLILNHRKLFLGDGGERSTLRYELTHQAIEVLVGTALPA